MKLYKRNIDPTAPYYARFQVRNKPYQWSTKTNDLNLAKKRAKSYKEAVVAERYNLVDGMKARGMTPITFGQLMADYKTFPSPAKRTRDDNCAALLEILAASRLNGASTIDRIGADLATNWQKRGTAHHPATTVNSVLRCARSLFSKRAMIQYRADLKPDAEKVRALFSVPCLREAQKRPELPTIEADQKAHALLPEHPEAWRAYLLCRYGGLRAGEVIASRRDWIEGNTLYVGGREFVAKSRKWRSVALPQSVVDILLAHEPGVAPEASESLIGGFPKQVVRRTLPSLLHQCGFPRVKPLHSARRLYGSIVYTDQGPAFARDALGHSTQQVTDSHYARMLTATAPVTFADYRQVG